MRTSFKAASGKNHRQLFCSAIMLIFLFVSPSAVFGKTEVSGRISQNTTWTLSGSPYIVKGDVRIYGSTNVKLTIEPGVEVRFEYGTGLFVGDNNWSQPGSLYAKGTELAPVKFTSNASSPVQGSWKGIYFSTGAISSESLLEHCIVEYGGDTYNTNIYCTGSYPAINNCTLRYSSGYPIRVEPQKMNLSGNTYEANQYQGTLIQGGKITEDTVWGNKGDESIYIVTEDVRIYGSTNVKLTIEPGVEVRFEYGKGLFVGDNNWSQPGSLYAKGTEQSPVKFTSNASSPVPGSWKGIYFSTGAISSESLLEHCIVEYGGDTYNANIYCTGSYPAINNCSLRYSSSYPIRVEPKKMNLSGNRYENNKYQGTLIEGGTINEDTVWGNKGDESTYIITGDVRIYWDTNVTLTIEPGVEMRFEPGTGLSVGDNNWSRPGSLYAKGTELAPVRFTSNIPSATSGSWKGIYFTTGAIGSKSLLEHCIVEYAGESHNANIYVNNSSPAIQYNTIRECSYSGIYTTGAGSSQTLINCNSISDNKVGIYTYNSSPQITSNNFENNETGLYNSTSGYVIAVNNWWNDANGPNNGGDTVSGNVTFTPWLPEPSACVSSGPPVNPPGGNCTEDDSGSIDIPTVIVSHGSPIIVPVRIQKAPNNAEALGFDITVPDGLIYAGFEKGSLLPSNYMADVSHITAGIFRCGAYRAGGSELISAGSSGEIIRLIFAADSAQDFTDSQITISELKDSIAGWSVSPGCISVNTECSENDTGSIDIPTVNVTPGLSVSIPVRIQNAPGKVESLGFDITIPYGLSYDHFEKGSMLPSNYMMDANLISENTLRCGAYRLGGTDVISAGESGEIIRITFQTDSSFTGSQINMGGLKDDIRTWTASPGCVVVDDCNGDINKDGDITPADALCAFQKYLMICPTSSGLECDSFCADVNRDGTDTPADALCIFRKYLKQPSCLD
ncbi:MAG: right-handed parallel beta-helix repeat-containing protein [Desulfococcaceae bacterium]